MRDPPLTPKRLGNTDESPVLPLLPLDHNDVPPSRIPGCSS
jgi:hypothetical protein